MTMDSDFVPRLSWIDLPPAARRVALWGMIVSLVACSLVAIGVLLYGTFDETTGRILGTLGALAFHCGVFVGLAQSRDRGMAPWLARLGVAAFAINFVVMLFDIWWPRVSLDFESIGQTLALCVAIVLPMPASGLLRSRRALVLARSTLLLCAMGLAYWLFLIWTHPPGAVWFEWGGVAIIAAFTLSHTCLLLRLRLGGSFHWVRQAAIVLAMMTGAIWSIYLVWDAGIDEGFLLRLLAAAAVADACATISLLVLKRLHRSHNLDSGDLNQIAVEIRCPRCATEQEIPLGESGCRTCGLKISLEIDSDRCIKCGYLLAGLPKQICPECGTGF